MGKSCARGLEYGPRPTVVLKTKGTVFPYTDRPCLVNNLFNFFGSLFLKVRKEIGNCYSGEKNKAREPYRKKLVTRA